MTRSAFSSQAQGFDTDGGPTSLINRDNQTGAIRYRQLTVANRLRGIELVWHHLAPHSIYGERVLHHQYICYRRCQMDAGGECDRAGTGVQHQRNNTETHRACTASSMPPQVAASG